MNMADEHSTDIYNPLVSYQGNTAPTISNPKKRSKPPIILFLIGGIVFVLIIVIVIIVTLPQDNREEQVAQAPTTTQPPSEIPPSPTKPPNEVATPASSLSSYPTPTTQPPSQSPTSPAGHSPSVTPIQEQHSTQANVNLTNKAILQVGKERIYQRDYEIEKDSYPFPEEEGLEEKIMAKLRDDSIVLQGAAEDGLVNLDTSVFDNPLKDYNRRIRLVRIAQSRVADKGSSIEGYIISIWPFNGPPPNMQYKDAQQDALAKIVALHNEVREGRLSIEEAGEAVKRDRTLADMDPNYRQNAITAFKSSTNNQEITQSKKFDEIILSLEEGEVTRQIFVAKGPGADGKGIVYFYAFAQVTKRIENTDNPTYDAWIAGKSRSFNSVNL